MSLSMGTNARIHSSVQLIHSDGRNIKIGDDANFYRGTEILGPVQIGSNVFINRDAYIRPNVTIGDNVRLGPFVRIVSDSHEIGPATQRAGKQSFQQINIGKGTWLGASVTVLGGVTIGSGCVVAAGAVVISDIPDNTFVGGVPARVIRSLPE